MPNRVAAVTVMLMCATLADAMPPASRRDPGARPLVEVLVDGVERPQYEARGTRYIEATEGRDYEIRLRNPFPVRVAVALSVDGLNTIDARHTTAADARKWVLAPYETITLQGWQVSRDQARRFTFTTEERSYGHRLGQTANLGTISAVYFRERQDRAWPTAALDIAAPPPATPAPEAAGRANADEAKAGLVGAARARESYAATGQGSRTNHRVARVHVDLEDTPAATATLRYEFRAQLVQLGVVPPNPDARGLARRERARGFEDRYCPEIY